MRANILKPRFVATMRRELINGHYDIESLHIYATSRNAAYQQARKVYEGARRNDSDIIELLTIK